MSDRNSDICREGVVQEYADGRVRVLITVQSACASCHAKGACTALDMSEKVIDARADGPLSPGDRVTVSVAGRYGWTAVLYAFVLPMVALGAVFFGIFSAGASETVAGLVSLGAVIVYFAILRLLRDRLFGAIEFHAQRIINSQ